ncbi:MAG: 8-amino-7-oxononanoate synthase [Holophagaceae bacterium]|nr:8-amino-7-oxononanoate synthase [Holophagaceae bacterium]
MKTPRIPEPWQERLEECARGRVSRSRNRSIQPAVGLDFSSNDYLGLRRDPRLAEAGERAARNFGSGSGASRLLRGTSPLHDDLEKELALWKGQGACLLFNTGFQCNATVIPSLLQPGDAVFSDALNHASIVDGCRMAKLRGAHLGIYRHLDLADLQTQLHRWMAGASREALALVVTDAVFSMDGDIADLPALLDICHRHRALLMVDEAHASGLLGATGAGLSETQGVHGQVPLLMGTLGKALGTFGAFVACDPLLRDHLVNQCRGFIFSTALPPSSVGASLEALHLARTETWRRERALGHARRLREALALPEGVSPIVPIVIGSDADAIRVARGLQDRGFDIRAVRPPTVPEGTARLRITTGAHQEEADVEALVLALRELL